MQRETGSYITVKYFKRLFQVSLLLPVPGSARRDRRRDKGQDNRTLKQ